MVNISAIVIDDERLAREGLRVRLREVEDFTVVGECGNGREALDLIQKLDPDVIFVDIAMPGLNGIELVEILTSTQQDPPKVVFVTAFDHFALQAFNHQAFDYLLKPFTDDRLERCLAKLRTALKENQALHRQDELEQLLSRKTGKSLDGFITSLEQSRYAGINELQQTISLKSGNDWLRINLDSILWIEAAGDYMYVHTSEGNHIVRQTLKQLEKELDRRRFIRVNRSAIVNLSQVVRLSPNSNGEYSASLASGQEIKVSRKYKLKLNELARNGQAFCRLKNAKW